MNFLNDQDVKMQLYADTADRWHAERRPTGAIGGLISYIVTPTNLGLIVKMQNNVTQEIVDVTRYDLW